MIFNMTDIDNIRAAWQGLDIPSVPDCPVDSKSVYGMKSHKDSVMRQYRIFAVIAGIWAVLTMPFMCLNPVIELPLWAGAYMSAYFVVMCLLSLKVYYAVKDINIGMLSVRECLETVFRVKKLRFQGRVVGAILVIPLLAYLLSYFYHIDRIMFVGAVSGAVFGLIAGILADMRIRRHLREMSRYLKTLDASERVTDGEMECE
jgi:hypothetical protein